ncbi:MAG TPA: TIR domain-containing protein [Anaerolineales bacterium]|nr:TIR domain-containing protein [Anaerolineales bacterium]
MMGRIEKTVFISYRRTNLPWALFVYQNLTIHGYDVFFDYQSIDSGNFESVILDNIRARAHFIVILTPSALDNCNKPDDWLRREIETAIEENRNIIPFMVENFDFGSQAVKNTLTGKLKTLSTYNGLPVQNAYVFEAMERLRNRFLNKALSDVPKAILQVNARKITETQKAAANNAPLVDVEKEFADTPIETLDLSARTWNTLSRLGAKTVGDVLNLLEEGESGVPSIRNFGESSLDQLRQLMQEKGYLKDD